MWENVSYDASNFIATGTGITWTPDVQRYRYRLNADETSMAFDFYAVGGPGSFSGGNPGTIKVKLPSGYAPEEISFVAHIVQAGIMIPVYANIAPDDDGMYWVTIHRTDLQLLSDYSQAAPHVFIYYELDVTR